MWLVLINWFNVVLIGLPGIPALLHLGKKSQDLALDPQLDHSQGQEEDQGPEVMEGMSGTLVLLHLLYVNSFVSVSQNFLHDLIRAEDTNPGNTLYVTGLSSRVTQRDLEEHFSKEGKVGFWFTYKQVVFWFCFCHDLVLILHTNILSRSK